MFVFFIKYSSVIGLIYTNQLVLCFFLPNNLS